jgi:hypothetical protein
MRSIASDGASPHARSCELRVAYQRHERLWAIGDPRPASEQRGDDIVGLTVATLIVVLRGIATFEMPVPAGGGALRTMQARIVVVGAQSL